MFTLACPFVNKGIGVHRLWIENLKRIRLPRSEMKLLFVDMCKNEEITWLYQNYLKEHGSEWLKVEYLKDPPKEFRTIEGSPPLQNVDDFAEKRRTVAETMQIINEHREGDMVLWEDDIIVPDNAFEYMLEVWKDQDTYSVGGVQYTRTKTWAGGRILLMWDFDELGEPRVRTFDQEQDTGTEAVGATATGFQLYKAEFLDNYSFKCDYTKGQDIITGREINKLGKKVVVCWEMKFPHLALEDKFIIYRSEKCKTPVLDYKGEDLMLNKEFSIITKRYEHVQLDRKSSPLFVKVLEGTTDKNIIKKYKYKPIRRTKL